MWFDFRVNLKLIVGYTFADLQYVLYDFFQASKPEDLSKVQDPQFDPADYDIDQEKPDGKLYPNAECVWSNCVEGWVTLGQAHPPI